MTGAPPQDELHRVLGPVHLTLIGIGCIIGAGIFVIAGTAAAEHAGPAVLLSFVIAAVGCGLAGLCYAELAAMIPHSGSSYTYAYATMGRFMAWFIGWNMVLEYGVSVSTVAAGASGYFLSLLHDFGIGFPAIFAAAPFAGGGLGTLHLTGAVINLPAVALVTFLTAFLMVGVSESARLNAVMVMVKIVIVIAVIVFGLPHVTGAHLTPFVPPNQGSWGHFGASGVLAASGMIFFSYLGFETVSAAAQETRNPQRDLPIGILASLGACTILYLLMALVLVGVTDWRTLDVPNPVSFAIGKIPSLSWLVLPVDIGALAGLTTVAFTSLYGQTRIFYCMARDGFLPRIFAVVHPRCRTPQGSTLITGAGAALLAALFPLDILADLVSIGTLLAFISVCAAVLILRRTAPNAARPFRTPLARLVAPAGIAACGLMMASLSNGTWLRLVLWTAIGFVIYFGYSVRHTAPSKWSVRDQG